MESQKIESNGPLRRQIISTVLGNLLTASLGASNGWACVNFVDLQKTSTPFPSGPLTLEQATFVMSTAYVGTLIGNFIFPFIVQKCGSKRTLFAIVFPQILSCLLIIYAQNPYYLYVSRFLTGIVGSGLMVALIVFVTEISHDKIRGTLNSVVDPFLNVGAMTAMLLGKNFDYVDQAKIQLIFPMIFMPLFIWVPESPQHLMSVQKEKAANKAHKFFNGTDLEKMPVSQASDNSLEDNAELTLKDFTNPRARKCILLALTMLCLNVLQGYSILISYMTEIFSHYNANVSEIDSSVILVSMLIVSSLIFLNLIDRAGRRTFYIYSSFASTIGLVFFAIYLFCLEGHRAFDWVPLVSVSYIVFIAGLGMNPIPFLIIIEIFPKKIAKYGFTGYVSLLLILLFIFSNLYPFVKEIVGLQGWIVFFAVASLCNALFGIFCLPETKGKSHEQIMQLLDNL